MAKNNDPSILISVVICTRNRKAVVEDTLASVATQSFPNDQYEIIVVDNNSDDGSTEWLQEHRDLYNYTLYHEEELGLSAARNCGIRHSKGRMIYFLDDDGVIPPYLLERLWKVFDETGAAAVGGPIHGLWAKTPPQWLHSGYWRRLSLVSWGIRQRELVYPEILLGGHIGWRRDIFDEHGAFDARLGRKGDSLVGNEEREIERRLMEIGEKFVYEPSAIMFHLVPEDRMTVEYFARRQRDGVVSNLMMDHMAGRPYKLDQEPGWKKTLRRLYDAVSIRVRSSYRGFLLMKDVYHLEMSLSKASREGVAKYRRQIKRGGRS